MVVFLPLLLPPFESEQTRQQRSEHRCIEGDKTIANDPQVFEIDCNLLIDLRSQVNERNCARIIMLSFLATTRCQKAGEEIKCGQLSGDFEEEE